MKKFYLLFMLLLGVCFSSHAQVSVFIDADTTFLRIGEQLTITYGLQYRVDGGDYVSADIPNWESESDSVIVVSQTAVDTALLDENDPYAFQQSKTLVLTSFDSANYVLPPLPVLWNGDTIYTNELSFFVNNIAVDTTQAIADIKPIWDVNYGLIDVLMENKFILIGLLMLPYLITGLIIWLRKRNRKEEEIVIENPEPEVPIHIWALEELQQLKDKKAWQVQEQKVFFSQINYVLRKYLEDRFRMKALEETSSEIMNELKYRVKDKALFEDLYMSLNLTDMVKFAQQAPTESECVRSLELVIQLVDKTKELDTPVKQENEKV